MSLYPLSPYLHYILSPMYVDKRLNSSVLTYLILVFASALVVTCIRDPSSIIPLYIRNSSSTVLTIFIRFLFWLITIGILKEIEVKRNLDKTGRSSVLYNSIIICNRLLLMGSPLRTWQWTNKSLRSRKNRISNFTEKNRKTSYLINTRLSVSSINEA